MVDRILECEPGKSAVGVKAFSRADPMFMDHFPGFPLVPGVVQVEMIAQLGGKCIVLAEPKVQPVLGSIKSAKFIRQITPGDRCVVQVQIEKLTRSYALAKGEIRVEGEKVSEAEILYGILERVSVDADDYDWVIRDWQRRQAKERSP